MEAESIQGPHGEEDRYETKEQSLGLRSWKKDSPTLKLIHNNNNNNGIERVKWRQKSTVENQQNKQCFFYFQKMKKIDTLLD